MNPVALLPLGVFVAAVFAIGIMVARAADEAEQLWAEIRSVGQLRPLLVEIGDETHRLRSILASISR